MRFCGDDRAQSVQVGAVILFGFLVVAMAGYQANVVPAENRDVEFRHEQGVQEDMSDLRNALIGTGVGGDAAPQSVRLGMRYPDRTFFANPPPVPGALETGPERTLWLNDTALADSDANDAWNGTAMGFSTRALIHEAQYYVSGEDPENRIEHGLLYSAYENANVTRTDQPVVSGNRLTLVTVNGSLDRAGTGSTTVDPARLSVSTSETTLEANGTPTVFLPTDLSAEAWNDTLAEQYDATYAGPSDAGDNGRYVTAVSSAPGGVLIELEPATYRLRLAEVGIGSNTDDPRATTVSVAEGDGGSITEDGTRQMKIRVTDRFTNPVAGREVDVSLLAGAGSLSPTGNLTTDENGLATVEFDPDPVTSTETVQIGFSLVDASTGAITDSDATDAIAEFDVTNVPTGNQGNQNGGNTPFNITWSPGLTNASDVTCYPTNDTCVANDRLIDLVADTDPTESGAPVTFETNTSDVSITNQMPNGGRTDGNGEATATLDATGSNREWATAYVSSVGSGDSVRVRFPTGGVYYQYYEGSFGGGSSYMPDYDAMTPTDTGETDTFNISERQRDDGFAFQYSAYIDVPSSGSYTFYTNSDDGSRLYIDGNLVVDNAGDQSVNEESGTTTLSPGEHNITVQYYENQGDEELTVSWEGPGLTGKEEIPESVLTPRTPSEGGPNGAPSSIETPDNKKDQNNPNAVFPPQNPDGVVSNFPTGISSNDNQVSQISSNKKNLNVGVRTTNVPTSASSYVMKLDYYYDSNGAGEVSLQLVDGNGAVLQSTALSVTKSETTTSFTLNSAAESYVKNNGELLVVYTNGGSKNTRLNAEYQRLEVY